MPKLLLLPLLALLLTGCGEKLVATKPECPAWKDAAKGHQAKLASEIDAAPEGAIWPDVLVADQSLKDQLIAGRCPPAN